MKKMGRKFDNRPFRLRVDPRRGIVFLFRRAIHLTVSIRNTGSVPVTLAAYYVKDSGNNQYANTYWSGPTVMPNPMIAMGIIIDGQAFTFQSGSTYTLTLVTSGNNQFMFTVIT